MKNFLSNRKIDFYIGRNFEVLPKFEILSLFFRECLFYKYFQLVGKYLAPSKCTMPRTLVSICRA